MPPKSKIHKEEVLNAALIITKEKGILEVNARSIAKQLNCSTNPIFRLYTNMEELKTDLIEKIYIYYHYFTDGYTFEDELLRISYAYIEFARKESNLFETIYISDIGGRRTLYEVINSSYNLKIIKKIEEQYCVSKEKADQIFRDVRFYAHGIATQVLVDSILLSENEVEQLLEIAIEKFKI